VSTIKHITLSDGFSNTFTTWITASMSDSDIYDKFRSTIGITYDILICDPAHNNEKV
jgi:hypothetical protein